MKLDEIKRRISDLEQRAGVEISLCLVSFPDGSEHEIPLADWLDHAAEWKMIRITQGKEISPLLCSLFKLESEITDDDPLRLRAMHNIRWMIEESGGIPHEIR